ncbi:MAG: hypothetical protein DCC67_12525 [Planctomycetota bacterium]|nr:MAG: hypothetical protein DCC67_12525 [Planctomycetota bacterium]
MSVTAQDLVEVVPYVWQCALGLSMTPASADPAHLESERLRSVVSLSGQWTGDLVLDCSLEVAREAASRMFCRAEPDLAFDEIQDALAELTNVVAGNIKSLIPGATWLGLPVVTSGRNFDQRYAFAALLCEASFLVTGAGLTVSVWEKLECESPLLAGARPV